MRGIHLVEIFHMMRAVPLVGKVVEAAAFGELIVFIAVPGQEIAQIERVQPGQIFGAGGLGEGQVVFGDAVAQQLFPGKPTATPFSICPRAEYVSSSALPPYSKLTFSP